MMIVPRQGDPFRPTKGGISPQLWDSRTLAASEFWRLELPEPVIDEFRFHCRMNPESASNIDEFVFDGAQLPYLADFADEVRHNLVVGHGVNWIRGLGGAGLSTAEMRLFYAALGCALGETMNQYGRLYEVRDHGGSYKNQAIPVSMTGAETGFHTDSSSRDVLPDFVGLLCETPSRHGGESQVSNALRVHQVMRREAPDALKLLYGRYIRDVITPGVVRSPENLLGNRIPVFAPCARQERIVFRYMRYWIEKGHEEAGEPLSDAQLEAFDLLDRLLRAREQVLTFQLGAGDILFVNNRTLAHNRTDYKDTKDNVRLLHRMWIQLRARPPAAGRNRRRRGLTFLSS